MQSKHFPRSWEHTRFWQREQEYGRTRYIPPNPEFDIPLPEHLRMPQTRSEMNRFKLDIKKSLVQVKRGQCISGRLYMTRLNRKLRKLEKEMAANPTQMLD